MTEEQKVELLEILMMAWDFLRVKGRADAEAKAKNIVERADAISKRQDG